MKHLSDLEKWKRLAAYDVNQAASDFADQPAMEAAQMADTLGVSYMVEVVSILGSDAAADLLRNLPDDFRAKVLSELKPEKAAQLREILAYKPGTAGALMAKEFLSVPIDATIGQASSYLQKLSKDQKGKVSYIYVVDREGRLEGVIQVRDIVFFAQDRPVREILKSPVVQVETGMQQSDVARLLQRHRYLGLPVVDDRQRLVGVISADSAMHALEDEASDDIAKIVGTGAGEIRATSVLRIMRFRLPWLFVNIASGLICALISGLFEKDLTAIAAVFLFVPVVLGLSESTGVQAATIVVRNLALNRFNARKITPLFLRELMAGVLIGSICGTAVGLFAMAWKGSSALGIVLSASMTASIIVSALIGLAMPLVFKRVKIDPAMASGPLALALCDIQTLLIYFNVASFLL